jgi:transcriptional regulator with XRE-family HTH domain
MPNFEMENCIWGRLIVHERTLLGMSQSDLSGKITMGKPMLSRYERGVVPTGLTIRHLNDLEEVFQVDLRKKAKAALREAASIRKVLLKSGVKEEALVGMAIATIAVAAV